MPIGFSAARSIRPKAIIDMEPGLARRLLWFVLLWCAGVATLAVIAYAIRLAIG